MPDKGGLTLKQTVVALKWMAGYARPFVLPLFILVMGGAALSLCGVGFALASRTLIDAATNVSRANLWRTGAVMLGIIALQMSIRSGLTVLSSRTLEEMGNQLRHHLFEKVARADWRAASEYHSGDLGTRMSSDVSTVAGGMVGLVPDLVATSVQTIGAFVVLYIFDPVMAILSFILGPILMLFGRYYARRLNSMHLRCQETESRTRSFLQESLQNLLVMKAFSLEARSSHRLQDLQSQHLHWVVKRSWLGAGSGVVMGIGYWTGYFLAITWGSYRLSTGMITFGTMAAFLQLVGQVQGPFFGFASSLPRAVAAIASARRLMEIEELPLETKSDTEMNMKQYQHGEVGIVVDNVSFAYIQDTFILERVSMEVRPGEIVAIIGPSGEGKTTLMRLLLALVTPNLGKIYISGSDERQEVSPATRKYFSFVPQGNTVFSGSIEDNLRIGNPKSTRDELESVARIACAWDFITEFPEGMGTIIGEQGLGLSEGQVQRLLIARALLRKTPILLLDEATSALDTDTEARVLQGIRNSRPGWTCIIVTHRPTIANVCDRIFRVARKSGDCSPASFAEIEIEIESDEINRAC